MSLTTNTAPDTSASPGRRQQRRYEPRELTYVDLGTDNGGILLGIDEDGLDFQVILPLSDGQIVSVEFKLPGMGTTIRAIGEFARKDNPGRGGGLRFVNLPEETRQQLREWIAGEVSRQENHPRSGEKEAAPDGTDLADPTKTSRPADPPAPSREQQSAVVSHKSHTLAITPIPKPAPLAPATPRAERSSAPPQNAYATVDHSQRSSSQAAAPRAEAVERKLPLDAAPSSSDTIRDRESRAVVSPHEQPIAPASPYKTRSAANQKVRREPAILPAQAQDTTREPLNLSSQALQFAGGVATGCLGLATIAGVLLWAGYLRLPSVVSSRTSTGQNTTRLNNQDFQVEIVNLDSQRWIMPMDADKRALPSEPPAQTQAVPAQNAETAPPRAADPAAKASRNRPASPAGPQLALQRPRAASAGLQAPSIFDGITPLLPSLDSPLPATVFPSPEPEAVPLSPIAVPPPAPQPETGSPSAAKVLPSPEPEAARPAKPMGFQPAELTQRFEPVYPLQARQQGIQGTVQVSATIGKDGIPRGLKAVRGDLGLAGAAMAVIARWRYKPAVLDGQPIESQSIITVNFRL
jgi:protein TonB